MSNKRYKRWPVDLTADSNAVISAEETLTGVMRQQGMNLKEATTHIFMIGVRACYENYTEGEVKTRIERNLKLSRLYRLLEKECEEAKALSTAIRTLGPDKVSEFAKECDVEISQLQDYVLPVDKFQSKSSKMRSWIVEYLSDGKLHKVGDIKESAIAEGVLPHQNSNEYESDYNTFKHIASEIGASGNGPRGFWLLKEDKAPF